MSLNFNKYVFVHIYLRKQYTPNVTTKEIYNTNHSKYKNLRESIY